MALIGLLFHFKKIMTQPQNIITRVSNHLSENPLRQLYFAGGQSHPPLLGYLVNFPRLTLVLKGRYELQLEQQGKPTTLQIGQGQAILAPPNCWDKPTWHHPAEVAFFLFGKKQTGISLVRAASEADLTADKIAIRHPVSGPAQKILLSLLELHEQDQTYPAFAALAEALVYACLALFQNQNLIPKSRGHYLWEDICEYLQQNFSRPLSRAEVADHFGIGPSHLSRVFQMHGYMTFSDYLAYVRIDRAKFMLSRYDLPLEAIARRCGYNDAPYFCRIFKRITRKTPSAYKRLIRSRAP